MTVNYEYHLHTGSGWTKVILVLSDDGIATSYFDSRWMSAGTERFRVTWSHERLSDVHGRLTLRAVERYTELDSDSTVIEYVDQTTRSQDTGEESELSASGITYEYISLTKSEIWIVNDPVLDEMRSMGHAWWHDRFDFFLWQQFSGAMQDEEFRNSAIGTMLSTLDKMKFESVAEPVFGYTNPFATTTRDSDIPF